MRKVILTLVWVFVSAIISYSQIFEGSAASQIVQNTDKVWLKEGRMIPSYIHFSIGNEIIEEDLLFWLQKFFGFSDEAGLKAISQEETGDEIHKRYKLTYNGVEIYDQMVITHSRAGYIYAINGDMNPSTKTGNIATLSEQDALTLALVQIDAEEYKWEMAGEEAHIKQETGDPTATYYPTGEIVLFKPAGKIEYYFCYKFNVYANKPLYRAEVFVDASTGEIHFENLLIHPIDVNGVAVTKYSGTQNIVTDSTGTTYRLRESGRGNGIETYNMNQGTSYNSATDFTDADNYWNNFNTSLDEVATDAHWGSEMTYDYFYYRYNRNSIDNNGFALKSYVHYDNNYANAFWDGQRMTYGDGNGTSISPLTALDITAHEISHGLTSFTSNLVYQDEPGALNESFSDIFGVAVEWYAKPALANWTMGENIGSAFRSMSNPNAYGDPDCYHGTNWYFGTGDNGGVHTNSGVLNHWFYLLSDGGNGVNDNNDTFNVNGITIDSAGAIAFRTNTVYLTNSSQYIDARFYAIQSAIDLFGACSPEVESTTNAMYAVGVGVEYQHGVHSDFIADNTLFCAPPAVVNYTNNSINGINMLWDFGDNTTSTALNPTHTYINYGAYTVTLTVLGGTCGQDTTIKIDYINVDPSNPCIFNMPVGGTNLISSCNGMLYDTGGNQPYQNNSNSIVTINPPGALNVTLNFQSFSFESGFDYLYIYDGPSTTSTLIGAYDGNTLPNGGTITSTGSSITLRESTDVYLQEDGFVLNWSCNYPPVPPVADFKASDTVSCSGQITFTDLSTNGPTLRYWEFGDGGSSTYPAPTYTYQNNGVYTVTLICSNTYGADTIQKTNFITINKPVDPVVNHGLICNSGTDTLIVNNPNGDINWYDQLSGGIILHVGDTFITPTLSAPTTYYAEEIISKGINYGAKANNTGGGGYYTSAYQHYLVFDCYKPVILKSVLVYAGSSGNRLIELMDMNGTVILSKTINIPQGNSRITLDFNIPVGSGFQLAGPLSPDLYRNNSGTNYPYQIGNLITIIESSAGTNPTGYYYYFYDWEVEEEPCRSLRQPVNVYVSTAAPVAAYNLSASKNTVTFTNTTQNPGANYWDFDDGNISTLDNPVHIYNAIGNYNVELVTENGCGIDSVTQQVQITTIGIDEVDPNGLIKVYPNPSNGSFALELSHNEVVSENNISVVDIMGRKINFIATQNGENKFLLNLHANASGIYTVRIQFESGVGQIKISVLK